MKGTRVAHPARLAARVRLSLADQYYFDVYTPRFRWRMLQPWVSTSRWFFIVPASCMSSSWYCDVVNGVRGCCRNGKTCGTDSDNVVCTTAGYVPCTGLNFCCREPFPSLYPCIAPLTAGYLSFRPYQPSITNVSETLPVTPNVV